MARVTDTEVKTIFPTVVDTTPFITSAALLVDEVLNTAGFSDARLKQIELYLSAHFAAITVEKGGLVRQKVDDSEEDYKGISFNSSGLLTTRFGQQAIAMDTSGALGALSKNPVKALFRVLKPKPLVDTEC